MARKTTTTATTEDPLADLRDTDDTLDASAPLLAAEAVPVAAFPLVNEAQQDEALAVLIATWHDDTVAVGFLHKGGACGCHYLGRQAVRAVLPLGPEGEA